MKTLILKTQTEDDLKILREALTECAQAIRQAFQIGQETAERNREELMMATIMEATSKILTKDDLEVMDECLSLQLRTLRSKVVTTWKDKEYYDKVKTLRKEVEEVLDSLAEIRALREEKEEE